MANKRVSMEKILRLLELKETTTLSIRSLARVLGLSRTVIAKYLIYINECGLKYGEAKEMSESELITRLNMNPVKKLNSISRYQELSGYFEYILKERKKTGVTLQLLWLEYKEKHPQGYEYTQFCHHLKVFQSSNQITMHIEHKAGDKLFVDFTGAKFPIYDPKTGEKREAEVFVAILGGSQYTYCEACESQKKEDFIGVTDNALWFLGGAPQAIVPDCLKSAVTTANKYEPDLNPQYADFARHYHTVILPARPIRPKDKAYVENAVKLVYMRIFAPLRNRIFHSISELNVAMWELLAIHNQTKFQRLDKSRKEYFEETDKPALKPLPPHKYELRRFQCSKAQFNYHIYLSEDKHYYSVPWKFKGKKVKTIYDQRVVEIYYENQRIAHHFRERSQGRYTTNKEHMPAHHRFYDDWSPEKFINWAEKQGNFITELVEKVLVASQHPEAGFKTCLGILNLAKKYESGRVNLACKRALLFGSYSYKTVKNILDKGLEKILDFPERETMLPPHENIRGSNYFNKEVNEHE